MRHEGSDIKISALSGNAMRPPFLLFIPFFILYVLFAPAMTSFLCLCPTKDPNWKCGCGCPKCIERRQTTFLSFDAASRQIPVREHLPSSKSQCCPVNTRGSLKSFPVSVTIEPAGCTCQKRMEGISPDPENFIASWLTPALTIHTARIFYPDICIHTAQFYPHLYERPG